MSIEDGKSNNLDWWYDEQIKRYMTQLVRFFSQFRVREYTKDGVYYNRVPARYADTSRLVSHIVRNNSENIINSAPMITCAVAGIKANPDMRRNPFHVDTAQVAEREFDTSEAEYTANSGNLYTIQKYMPTPYSLDVQVDLWTTNTDTKLQLLEQILILFNPGVQIQNNKNAVDWSSVFEITLENINWSNRGIPTGVDDILDIATLNFDVNVWLNPPTKVKRQQIIQTIVQNMYANDDVEGIGYDSQFYDFFRSIPEDNQTIITPKQYECLIKDSTATLIDPTGNPAISWRELLESYGIIQADSTIKLNTTNDIENTNDIITGTISYSPDPTVLNFNLISDTLDPNTLDPIDRIVDPMAAQPGAGLPAPQIGQRYLLTQEINSGNISWGGGSAKIDDIIQFNGTTWVVVFDASETDTRQYVSNSNTGKQYLFTGSRWQNSYEGTYNPGFWRLYL